VTRLLQRQPSIALAAGAAALLVLVIGIETGFGTRLSPAIPAGASKKAPPHDARILPQVAAIDAQKAYPEMVARPLFTPTRRPAPPAQAQPQAMFKRDQYLLQGVIIAGNTRIAMLREKATGKVYRVEKGRELNGVTLAEVNPESVTLALGKDQEVLPLQVLKQPSFGAPPSPGPFGAATAGPGAGPAPPGQASQNPAAVPQRGTLPPNVPKGPDFGPPVNPNSGAVPQATSAPLTPEELLARRRARRVQQNQ
jgi:hypothetical protein